MAKPKRITVFLCVLLCSLVVACVLGVYVASEVIGTPEAVTSKDRARVPTVADLMPGFTPTQPPSWSHTRYWFDRVEVEYELDDPEIYMRSWLVSTQSEYFARKEFYAQHDTFDMIALTSGVFDAGPYELSSDDSVDQFALYQWLQEDAPYGALALIQRDRFLLLLHIEGVLLNDDELLGLLDRYLTRLVHDDAYAAAG